jgi:hypothetical protein
MVNRYPDHWQQPLCHHIPAGSLSIYLPGTCPNKADGKGSVARASPWRRFRPIEHRKSESLRGMTASPWSVDRDLPWNTPRELSTMGRNPQTGEKIKIKGRNIVTFKPSKTII